MIRALVFDLDGTLANTERLHYRAWRQALAGNGVENISFETYLMFAGTSSERVAGDYILTHSIDKSISELVLEKQKLYMELIPKIMLCNGAHQAIERFKGKKTLAVASSSHKKEVHAILKAHGLFDSFSHIVCGDMVARQKPDPEIYLTTCRQMNIPPEQAVAFEDSTHGLQAAKKAGMFGVAIPNEFTKDHDFSHSDLILESLKDFDETLLHRLTASNSPV